MIRKKESSQFRFPGSVDRMAHSFSPPREHSGINLQFSTSPYRTLVESNLSNQSSIISGRKKKKNMSGLLAIPLLIGGTLVPLALGALALLAGKALIVSKLALVLASIIGLKKLVSGGGDHGHEVVQVAGGHGSSGWARSSHDLAYSAYKPTSST